jgi:hypothetical protein
MSGDPYEFADKRKKLLANVHIRHFARDGMVDVLIPRQNYERGTAPHTGLDASIGERL